MTRSTVLPRRRSTGLDVSAAAGWLSATAAALVSAVSVAGLWSEALYRDPVSVASMFRGYDLVSLTIVAPLLGATLLPAVRGRPRPLLVRVSMLAYCVYNYAYYLFAAELNAALLAHVAIFTVSLYALVLSLSALDATELAGHFEDRTPVRTVAAVLFVLGVSLGVLQASGLLGFAVNGAVPAEPSRLVVPLTFTRLGAVLDLSLLVTAYLLAAVLLWRRHAWGYVLATMVLVAGAVHQVSYVAAMVFQLDAEVAGASFDLFEPVIVLLFLVGAALLLVHVRTDGSEGPTPQVDGRTRLDIDGESLRPNQHDRTRTGLHGSSGGAP